jgi:CRISPR-associated endonuclease/helicase Cas3
MSMSTSDPTSTLWAKRDQRSGASHPLLHHLLDTANVAGRLWEHRMPPTVRQRLAAAMGLDPDGARSLASLIAGLHDLGKATPPFQRRLAGIRSGLDPRHDAAGEHLVREWLQTPPLSMAPASAATYAEVVGCHHGSPAPPVRFGTARLGGDDWKGARASLVSLLARHCYPDGLPALAACPALPVVAQAMLAALVCLADWIASNEGFFPYAEDTPAAEYLPLSADRADAAIRALGWSDWAPATPPLRFAELFGHLGQPRPLQVAVESALSPGAASSLILIEAPMGEGKTEAAEFVADHLGATGASWGLYMGLPTMATANAMYDRVGRYLEDRYPAARPEFRLLHGHAFLSRQADLWRASTEGAEAHGEDWFGHRKRGLLAPLGVGTVDQALMAALRTRHSFVRLLGLAGKTVIIDEVHAYDAYTSQLLVRMLRWLREMDASVVLLSATLPAATRRALVATYTDDEGTGPAAAYPRVTIVRNGAVEAIPCSPCREFETRVLQVPAEGLAERLDAALRDGGCAAVILNTVPRAQTTYQGLRDALEPRGIDVDLFHARYPLEERLAREGRVVGRFGRDTTRRPERAVLVATQVIEQSLDLDFDLMVTEHAPVDLLLQRSGRMHRHALGSRRPRGLSEPTLWLLESNLDAEGVPAFGNSAFVYSEYVLLRSWLALGGRRSIRLPGDVESLIESVYGPEPDAPAIEPAIARRLAAARARHDEHIAKLARSARDVQLPDPNRGATLSDLLDRVVEDDAPDVHALLQARTRWSDQPSITLVCLHDSPEGPRAGPGGPVVDLAAIPCRDFVRTLISRSVSLTRREVYGHFVCQGPPAGWKGHAALRHARAAVFDEAGRCTDFSTLRWDEQLGILIEPQAPNA